MRISGTQPPHLSNTGQKRNSFEKPQGSSIYIDRPNDKVEIRTKKIDHLKVGDNNPDRPLVSTKVLDSLSTDMINFNQKERDVIAEILGKRANDIRNKRAQSNKEN